MATLIATSAAMPLAFAKRDTHRGALFVFPTVGCTSGGEPDFKSWNQLGERL